MKNDEFSHQLDLKKRILVRHGVIVRKVKYGGMSKANLLKRLITENIHFNEYARVLWDSEIFETSPGEEIADIVELSVKDLELPNGATFEVIFSRIKQLKLNLCPLEIGPYLRLNYLDQKEEVETGKNKAPKGSITIFSKIEKPEDEEFPKGFYIRKIDGKLWLRGYICPMDYIWDPEARIALKL